jgi:hypothetical protein
VRQVDCYALPSRMSSAACAPRKRTCPPHLTRAPRHGVGPVPHLLHEHPVWLGQAGLAWRGTVAHATSVPACCHLSQYIVTICRWGLCSRSPQSTSQGAAVCASTHKGGMAPLMARGQQAGVSVGTEHAPYRSSSALYSMVTALSAAITDERRGAWSCSSPTSAKPIASCSSSRRVPSWRCVVDAAQRCGPLF